MARFIVLLFGLVIAAPFWLQFIFAGGAAYFGYTLQENHAERIAHRAELLQAAPPATIDIAKFTKKYASDTPTEISVTAQVALDHNTKLIRKTNFITTDEDVLYMLVDADAPKGETVARGAIVIDPDQVDILAAWISSNLTDLGGGGPVVKVDGLLDNGPQTSMVSDALQEQGMTKGPNFFYVAPYFEGRDAALAVKPNEAMSAGMPLYCAALFFVLVGCFKGFFARRNAKQGPAKPAVPQGTTVGVKVPASVMAAELPPTNAESAAPVLVPTGFRRNGAAEYEVPAKDEQPLDAAMRARIEAAMANPKAAFKAPVGDAAIAASLIAGQSKPVPKSVFEQISSMGTMKFAILAVVGLVIAQQFQPQLISVGLPFVLLGLMYFTLYKASSNFKSAVGNVVDAVTDKIFADKVSTIATKPLPAATPFAPSTTVMARARDKFASSPIKSGGFSFGDLMPQRKVKPMPGPDPFDRLAERVRAERLK